MVDEWDYIFICASGIRSEVAVAFAKVDVDVDLSGDWWHCRESYMEESGMELNTKAE